MTPVMYVDPSGTMPKWLSNTLKIAVGAAIVVGLAIASGGTAPILIGAAMGAGAGFIGGGVVGGISEIRSGGNFFDGLANGALIGSIVGAVTGSIGASALGVTGQVVANSFINSGGYILEQVVSGRNVKAAEVLTTFIIGGFEGYLGGNGYLHKSSSIWLGEAVVQYSKKNVIKEVVNEIVVGTISEEFNRFSDFITNKIDRYLYGDRLKRNVIH